MANEMKDLKFPSVRTVLWDRASQGPAVNVDISSFRKFQICLSSKAVYILQEHCSGLVENQLLLLSGYVHSDNDGSKFSILVDPLDVSNLCSETNEKSLQISVLVSKSNKCGFIPEDYNRAVKNVINRCGSKDQIGIGSFFSVLGKFFVQTENGNSAYCVEFDVFTSAARFEAVPINPVTIMTTALAKNLASPMSLSRLQGKAKSGYVTMDHTRKLVLMLESDPKVSTLPLIGIWVSGVDCVKNPYVWASCLRYIYNNSLNQRVCLPPHRFMLLLYCLQGNKIEFYECGLVNEKEKTHDMDAFCGSKTVRLDFDQEGLEVDLSLLKYGIKKNRIDSVAARVSDKSKSKPSSSCVNDEIIPRTIPTPHQSKIPEARFSVPEVSLIFNDTSQPSLQRKCHDTSTHTVPNKIKPPSPSNYSSPVCTQGLPSLPMRNSYPSSKVGNAIYSASLAPTQFCQQPSKPLMYSGVPINQNITTDGNMYTNHPTLQPVHNRNPLPVSEYNRSVYPSTIHFPNKEIIQGSNSEQHPHFQYYTQNNLIPLPNSYTHHPKPVMDNMPNSSPYGPFPSQPNFVKPSPCFTSPVMCERYQMVNSHPMLPHSSMSTYPRTAIDKLPTLPSCPCCIVHVKSQPNPSYHHTNTSTIPPPNQAPVINVCQGHEKNINCVATHIQCLDKHNQEIALEKVQQTNLNPIDTSNSSYSNTPPNNLCNSIKENIGARQHENSVIEVSEDQNFRASKDSGLSESPDSSQETDPQLSKIQRDNIPPEIYRLLMRQSAELQELKAQIQQMKIDQNSAVAFNQSLNPCSTCSSVVSAKSESSESKASSEKSVERYSVGVNTSFRTSASPVTTPNNLIHLRASPRSPLETKADNFSPVSAPTTTKMKPTSSVSSQTWPPHHKPDGSYTLAMTEFSHGDFSAVAQCLSVNQKSAESFHSDLVLDLPSYQTSLSRSSDHQAIEGVQTSESANGLVSVSMCAKRTSRREDQDFEEDPTEEIPGTIKNKEYYDGLINYVKELLQQESPTENDKHEKSQEKESRSPDSVLTSTNQDKESLISNNTSYLCSGFNSVDCTLLPKINYISMLLESDTETSMEINSMALKYLKDEQLTQMAKLRSQSTTPTAAKANNKNFLCQIMRYGLDSSSPDISKYGMSVNDLTFATRKYMEKHHLIEESDSKNMSFLFKDETANYLPNYTDSRNTNSPQILNSSENMALFERPKEVRQNLTQNKLNIRKPFQNIQQKFLPMSESTPMFKSHPKKQSPEHPQMFLQTPPPVLEGDLGNSSANERILDIAKLKQMPKLL